MINPMNYGFTRVKMMAFFFRRSRFIKLTPILPCMLTDGPQVQCKAPVPRSPHPTFFSWEKETKSSILTRKENE